LKIISKHAMIFLTTGIRGERMDSSILERIKGGLIVSCQALKEEPLHSPYIMSRMALAAKNGGACGIRANSVEDITEIRKLIDLPVIGIIKKFYSPEVVYITPTMEEVDLLVGCGADIIATDCTGCRRPNGETLEGFFAKVRKKYPNQLFMADCATYEEGMHAAEIGLDLIGTTLCGYTEQTRNFEIPNTSLMRKLVRDLKKPVIAEGGIWTPEELKEVMDTGVWAAVIGTAITRPMEITKRFVKVLQEP
jgi:N-acylglucosamine-6-phosphate 2-epimerase